MAAAVPGPLAETEPGRPVPRTVLVLVGSLDEDLEAARSDLAHSLLQMPLNYLGLRLREHAVAAGEPSSAALDDVRAVGTFLLRDEVLPAWVFSWLERQQRQRRVLHLGSLRPLLQLAGEDGLRAYLQRLGLGYDHREVADPARITVEFPVPALYPFESQPVYERVHLGPWNLAADNTAWLVTRDAESPRRPRTPIVTGPWGGLALQPWLLRIGGVHHDRRWYADPFAFCQAALGMQGLPAPDPSVQTGRRKFVLHVDGDGFESASSVVPGRECGEVFVDRVVDAYPVPMTVSFIVASLTDTFEPAAATARMRTARTLLARAWVEAGSHSVLHPLNWRRRLDPHALPRSVVWYDKLHGYQHDMVAEVRDSIAFIDRWLVSGDKRCRVMLWSGAANPTPAAIAAASQAGCENLNGGLFRWDRLHDSVGFVSPWGKRIGGEWQTFAGAANENEFPGFFTTMPGAFAHVDATLERTGGVRILKPANVYVHFYSAEHPARLAALLQLLDRWVRREETVPVFASAWAAAVRNAEFDSVFVPTPRGYRCIGFAHCRTVRFDGLGRELDWPLCRGLLGARRLGERLFVHLGVADAEIAFLPVATAPVPWLHLEQADCEVVAAELGERALRLQLQCFHRGTIVVAGAPGGAALAWTIGDVSGNGHADAAGRCALPVDAGTAIDVQVWRL